MSKTTGISSRTPEILRGHPLAAEALRQHPHLFHATCFVQLTMHQLVLLHDALLMVLWPSEIEAFPSAAAEVQHLVRLLEAVLAEIGVSHDASHEHPAGAGR